MLLKSNIYSPIIRTIPDESAFFSVLDPEKKITSKIIMENFINFFSYKDTSSGLTFFRFENYKNFGTIEGIEQCFISIKMLKKNHQDLNILFQLIESGFVILLPVDKKSIDFYGEDAIGTHFMLVYGADISREILFCKDFSIHNFVEFEVSIDSARKSLMEFQLANLREIVGLLAFRINDMNENTIDFSKVFMEFSKLGQIYSSDKAGYGLGAIDLYLKEVKHYPRDTYLIESWYVIANYLREAVKLMKIRFDILENEIYKVHAKKISDHEIRIHRLSHDTDNLFFNICKLKNKKIILSTEIEEKLTMLVNKCRQEFGKTSEYFCKVISECL